MAQCPNCSSHDYGTNGCGDCGAPDPDEGNMFEVGDEVGIVRFAAKTHEITGIDRRDGEITWIYICPVEKVGQLVPGQTWVPVTRITPDRLHK